MGRRGRFGKYGEIKRIARLWQAKRGPGYPYKTGVDKTRKNPPVVEKTTSKDRFTAIPAGKSAAYFISNLSRTAFHIYGPYENILPGWLESGKTLTLLGIRGEMPVAFAMLGPPSEAWHFPRTCELLAIAVEPEFQRHGMGAFLMRNIEKKAKQRLVQTLVLHTGAKNLAGQAFFLKCGFIRSDIRQRFYPNGQDALLMIKEIL